MMENFDGQKTGGRSNLWAQHVGVGFVAGTGAGK